MFIKKIEIKNFRVFSSDCFFVVDDLNVPDGKTEGSGLTVFVGENGCGKTTLIEAFSLPCVSFKADGFSLTDLNDPDEKTEINLFSESNFTYSGTMPRTKYTAKGFAFQGGIRTRGNKRYLSSILVTDQTFIKADGESKPKDNTPDLRLSVNNPWSGPRFNENDFLILDRNRTYQTRKGTYNDTRFDRLMDDFNYQYLKEEGTPNDYAPVTDELGGINNSLIQEAIDHFIAVSGHKLDLNILDNWKPYSNAFFGVRKDNLQTIPLSDLGSGYEMIFSLLYSFYLSRQGDKQLIILIDEPELHLHPKLQSDFMVLLTELSKNAQIIITTHSPLLVKQSMENKFISIRTLLNDSETISVDNLDQPVLPYNSANEINFIAFGLATEEYHNELYEELKRQNGANQSIKAYDIQYFQQTAGQTKDSAWKGNSNEVTRHTFIRNQIHHRAENGKASYEEIEESINVMRSLV